MARRSTSKPKRKPKVAGKPPDSEQRKIFEWLQAAHAGDVACRWLDVLCRRAGYAPVYGQSSPERVLVTAKQIGDGLGVTERTVRNWLKEGLPVYQENVGPRPALYDAFAVCEWHWRRQMPKTLTEEDILFGEGAGTATDYWTTQLRKEKTRQAKRENDLAEGLLLRTEDVGAELNEIARVFRSEAEAIERTHGREVGKDVRAMIDRAETRWRKLHDGDGEDSPRRHGDSEEGNDG